MRWFLHALPYNISNDIFINSIHNLKPGGLITIELRSINDNELKKIAYIMKLINHLQLPIKDGYIALIC